MPPLLGLAEMEVLAYLEGPHHQEASHQVGYMRIDLFRVVHLVQAAFPEQPLQFVEAKVGFVQGYGMP